MLAQVPGLTTNVALTERGEQIDDVEQHCQPCLPGAHAPTQIMTSDPTSNEVLGQAPTAAGWRAGSRRMTDDPVVLRGVRDLELSHRVSRKHREMLGLLGSQFTYASPCRVRNADQAHVALIRFSQAIESAFGITQEVMIFYSPYPDLQRRTFDAARASLRHLPRQVTPDLILLSSPDPQTRAKLEDWSTNEFRAIGLPQDEIDDPLELVTLLRQHIFARDLYYETTPVSGDRFFGRRPLLQSLRSDIRDGRVAGIFGLRKAGKTSVLSELKRMIDADGGIFLLRDLESLPSPPNDPIPELIADLRVDLVRALTGRTVPVKPLKDLGPTPTLGELRRALQELLPDLLARGIRLTLALDEIEYLVPAECIDVREGDMPSVAQFLGVLRSLAQENENFTFLLSGLTSALVESGRLYGRPNPLFSWAKTYFLSPFSRSEADELAQSVGQRMGIRLERGALDALFEATGGHAFLYRHLASSVVGTLPLEVMQRTMTRADVLRAQTPWRREVAGNIQEMESHVRRYYPDEAFLLDTLRLSPEDFSEYADAMPAEVGHLLQLGLVEEVEHEYQLTPVLLLL